MYIWRKRYCFRPLIRGFFFYTVKKFSISPKCTAVSVPSFGDSFFIRKESIRNQHGWQKVSVPSFGDSFFILLSFWIKRPTSTNVSVPSFGDSFFILDEKSDRRVNPRFPSPHSGILFLFKLVKKGSEFVITFPSPHSGILFLWQEKLSVPSHPETCFRPLIRGFFFYGAMLYADGCYIKTPFPSPHSGILFLFFSLFF